VTGDQRNRAKAEARAAIETATNERARGGLSDAEWQHRVAHALATAYLCEDDPRWQSGFDGDATLWREAREFVLDAVPSNGTLLDVGCAGGHLMECLHEWASERGLDLTLFGLEINADLADVARRRLPAWADRIYTGNVSDWIPPRRFTYIRTGLEYVPSGGESSLIERLMRDVVEAGGRVIVGPVSETDLSATVAAFEGAGVSRPNRAGATDHNGKTRYVIWAKADQRGRGRE
jgi:hypothetical protein